MCILGVISLSTVTRLSLLCQVLFIGTSTRDNSMTVLTCNCNCVSPVLAVASVGALIL